MDSRIVDVIRLVDANKAKLAFLAPLATAIGAAAASWIVTGDLSSTEIRAAAGGAVLACVSSIATSAPRRSGPPPAAPCSPASPASRPTSASPARRRSPAPPADTRGIVRVSVPGPPVPWQRARRQGKRYFTAPEVVAHGHAVWVAWAAAGRPQFQAGEAIALSALFYLPRPTEHLGTGRNAGRLRPSAPANVTSRPDIDNYLKLIADALNGHWWPDDSQIVCLAGIHKLYADPGEEPRTVIDAWACSTRIKLS